MSHKPRPRPNRSRNKRRPALSPAALIARLRAESRTLREEVAVEHQEIQANQAEALENIRELKTSRERYAVFFEFSPTAYVTLDRNGFIHEANVATAQLLGVDRPKLVNVLLSHFVVKGDVLRLQQHLARCRRGADCEPGVTELKITGTGGRQFDVALITLVQPPYATPLSQVRFCTALIEITARKRAEIALRQSEQRLALAASGARIGMFEYDMATKMILCTDQFARLFGMETRTTSTTTALSLSYDYGDWARRIHPEDLPRVEAEQRRCLEGRLHYEIEYRAMWPDQSVHWLTARGEFAYDSKGKPERMFGIAMDITDRKQAERQLTELNATLEQRVAERTSALRAEIIRREEAETARSEVLQRLASAQEAERAQISRDLHDQLGQDLTALKLALRRFQGNVTDSPAGRQSLVQMEQLIGGLIYRTQRLAWELHPASLDDFGLDAALERYTTEWARQMGVPVDYRSSGLEIRRLPHVYETTLYRIVQEALTNVARHAQAKRVGVLLAKRPSHVLLIIEDDGQGFDAESMLNNSGSRENLGLRGMRERATLAGGTAQFESAPGAGATILVRLPLVSEAITRRNEKTSYSAGGRSRDGSRRSAPAHQ